MVDKIEAVKKVSETMSKQSMNNPAEEMERMSSNKEHFQSLIDSTQPLKTSFERVDTKQFAVEETQRTEAKPVFAEENVSSQKSGSSTDQEQKRRQQQQSEEVEGVAATGSKKPVGSSSLIEAAGKISPSETSVGKATPQALQAQAKDMVAQIEQVKTQLSQAQGGIKPSYQTLLRNRLTHIDDNLKIALSKAGVEHTPPPQGTKNSNPNPLQRFVDYLTHSQHQIENLDFTINQLNMSGTQLSPMNMVAIQMKMGYVQQQIELFTSLLNKALESTKTIMNVQV